MKQKLLLAILCLILPVSFPPPVSAQTLVASPPGEMPAVLPPPSPLPPTNLTVNFLLQYRLPKSSSLAVPIVVRIRNSLFDSGDLSATASASLSSASYSATVSLPPTLKPGSYSVSAKPANYLRRRWDDIQLSPGILTTLNQTDTTDQLIAGDLDSDNRLTAADIQALLTAYTGQTASTSASPRFDIDGDGALTLDDFGAFISNWSAPTVLGDTP